MWIHVTALLMYSAGRERMAYARSNRQLRSWSDLMRPWIGNFSTDFVSGLHKNLARRKILHGRSWRHGFRKSLSEMMRYEKI